MSANSAEFVWCSLQYRGLEKTVININGGYRPIENFDLLGRIEGGDFGYMYKALDNISSKSYHTIYLYLSSKLLNLLSFMSIFMYWGLKLQCFLFIYLRWVIAVWCKQANKYIFVWNKTQNCLFSVLEIVGVFPCHNYVVYVIIIEFNECLVRMINRFLITNRIKFIWSKLA